MRNKKRRIIKVNKIQIIFIVILTMCILYISNDVYYNYKENQQNEKIADIFYERSEKDIIKNKVEADINTEAKTLANAEIEIKSETEPETEKMLRIKNLQKENSDIIGWISIPGTNIDYPVLQTNDNCYYLAHNYKKEEAKNGSIFLDKSFDIEKPSTNYLIYGHRNKYGKMFEDLIHYKKKEFYEEHPVIQFTTVKDSSEYEIISVFLSRVYNKNEKNVFRYYYFTDATDEEEFDYYVDKSKENSLYETGKTANYGDQLLTLSTCEYSQKDGRLAVVARKLAGF